MSTSNKAPRTSRAEVGRACGKAVRAPAGDDGLKRGPFGALAAHPVVQLGGQFGFTHACPDMLRRLLKRARIQFHGSTDG